MNNAPNTGNPIRESQVQTQLQNLNKDLTELENLTSQLYGRLESVIADRPEDDGSGNAPEPQLVGLADTLRDSSKRIYHTNTRLRTLLETIEL